MLCTLLLITRSFGVGSFEVGSFGVCSLGVDSLGVGSLGVGSSGVLWTSSKMEYKDGPDCDYTEFVVIILKLFLIGRFFFSS